MAKEESKLVEEVVENTESTEATQNKDEFNPLAFASDTYGENEKKEESENVEATETVAETTSETEETETEEKEQEEQEDGWAWDSNKENEEKKEDEYDWDGSSETKEEAPTKEESLTWAKVGSELGIEINTREEFLQTLNNYAQEIQQSQQQAPANSQVSELRSYLNFNDRDLVAEELKADGIEESEIEESLDKLEDSGMMKMKAKSIRRVINNAIDQQTTQAQQQAQYKEQEVKAAQEKAKKELRGQIKNMNEFMGGKVTKKQKEEVYRYATSNMMNDIYANHANVADVAMFMLYRKQIEKILRSQGLEDGKASIMDSIVSPNLNSGKGKSNHKVKTGKFDPKAFMSE